MDLLGFSVVMNSSARDKWAAAKWRASIAAMPALVASVSATAAIFSRSRNQSAVLKYLSKTTVPAVSCERSLWGPLQGERTGSSRRHDLDLPETSALAPRPVPAIERRRSIRPSRKMSGSSNGQKFPARRSAISRSSSLRLSIFSPDAWIFSLIRRRSLPSFDTPGFVLGPLFIVGGLSTVLAMTPF